MGAVHGSSTSFTRMALNLLDKFINNVKQPLPDPSSAISSGNGPGPIPDPSPAASPAATAWTVSPICLRFTRGVQAAPPLMVAAAVTADTESESPNPDPGTLVAAPTTATMRWPIRPLLIRRSIPALPLQPSNVNCNLLLSSA